MTDGISVVVVNIKHALYSGILPEYTILCISCKCYTILILNTSLNLVRGSQQDWNGDLWIVLALETVKLGFTLYGKHHGQFDSIFN